MPRDDLARDIESSRSQVSVEWSDVRSEVNREAVMRKLEKQAARRGAGITLFVVVALAGAAAFLIDLRSGSSDAEEARNPSVTETASPDPVPTSGGTVRDDDWRALVQRGEFENAWAQIESGQGVVEASAPALADAADAAMRSGEPERAVEYLETVLRDHADDPRAALAAFTLGRVHIDRLGHPREAAGSFRRAYELARGGSLAEDALAAEVEAWAVAGELGTARQRAQAYEERFPEGRFLARVRRLTQFE